jgi:hypothetical protein
LVGERLSWDTGEMLGEITQSTLGINKGWAFAIGNTETRWLSRLWNDWRSALLLVKPETVIA